jgi:hypothetical protein
MRCPTPLLMILAGFNERSLVEAVVFASLIALVLMFNRGKPKWRAALSIVVLCAWAASYIFVRLRL